MIIDKSKISLNINSLTILANEFYDYEKSNEYLNWNSAINSKQSLYDEIENMPESAQINMSFSFRNRMTISEFFEFMKQYPNTYVNYCAVNMIGSFPIGFNLVDLEGLSLSKKFNEKYPCMNTNIENKKINFYEIRYRSLLQLMIDNKDFYSSINDVIPYISIQEELERIEKEGVTLIGFKATVGKEDALHLLKLDDIITVNVSDAKFSRLDY